MRKLRFTDRSRHRVDVSRHTLRRASLILYASACTLNKIRRGRASGGGPNRRDRDSDTTLPSRIFPFQ